jgi:hypothetical protein
MPSIPGYRAIRRRSTRYGVGTVVAGLVLLIALRLWASPIAREVTGRGENGLIEFLLIPVFLGVVGFGILLFLWEPDRPSADDA